MDTAQHAPAAGRARGMGARPPPTSPASACSATSPRSAAQSGVGAQIDAAKVPTLGRDLAPLLEQRCIPGGTTSNLDAAAETTDFDAAVPAHTRTLLADAQTSGGLAPLRPAAAPDKRPRAPQIPPHARRRRHRPYHPRPPLAYHLHGMNSPAQPPDPDATAALRTIPSVDRVSTATWARPACRRPLVVDIVRRELDAHWPALADAGRNRSTIRSPPSALPSTICASRVSRPVINGTGVIVHTNLGRSPLAPAAVDAIATSRQRLHEPRIRPVHRRARRPGRLPRAQRLATLCGAEAATVVNNCAAALVLILRHFDVRRPDPTSSSPAASSCRSAAASASPRSSQASGATLREVGTTNRTSLDDYAAAIDDRRPR